MNTSIKSPSEPIVKKRSRSESGSESSNQNDKISDTKVKSSNRFARKKIRKIEKNLADEAKLAQKLEIERMERLGFDIQPSFDNSDSPEIIELSSDEELEDKQKSAKHEALSSSTEEQTDDWKSGGLHIDDTKNVSDNDGRILVNLNHPTSDNDIFLPPYYSNILKPHQIGGIRFLYDNIIESPNLFKKSNGFGCILAHSMGLGKTLQLIVFIDIFLKNTPSKKVLCVVPVNTIENWRKEFDTWLLPSRKKKCTSRSSPLRSFPVLILNETYKSAKSRINLLKKWHHEGGVIVMGYEMFRLLSLRYCSSKNKQREFNYKNHYNNSIFSSTSSDSAIEVIDLEKEEDEKDDDISVEAILIDPGADLVVCDEGHRMKNYKTAISNSLAKIKTRRRIVLTGYPLQNNLMEYWCMIDFVRPNFLGSRAEFSNMFERPIANGQCIDSTERDVTLMKYRAHILHKKLKGFVQRRRHTVVEDSLPKKVEYVLLLRLSDIQRQLYLAFLNANNIETKNSISDSIDERLKIHDDSDNDVQTSDNENILNSGDHLKINDVDSDHDNDSDIIVLSSSSDEEEGYDDSSGGTISALSKLPTTTKMSSKKEKVGDDNINDEFKYDNDKNKMDSIVIVDDDNSNFKDNLDTAHSKGESSSDGEQQNQQTSTINPLKAFSVCCKIWNHPDALYHYILNKNLIKSTHAGKRDFPTSTIKDSINTSNNSSVQSSCENDTTLSSLSDVKDIIKLPPSIIEDRSVSSNGKKKNQDFRNTNDDNVDVDDDSISYDWSIPLLQNYQDGNLLNGSKFSLMFGIIKQSLSVGDKVLVFSQSLYTLSLIEDYLQRQSIPSDGDASSRRQWRKGIDYLRLDGSTPGLERERLIRQFNDSGDEAVVFLLSTRAGCLGVNLIGANRVIVMDASWNPCYDCQAVCRVYRYGQTKECFIYRLIADGTMERRIFDRQICKQGMANRVIDQQQSQRHFTAGQLTSLLVFEEPTKNYIDMERIISDIPFDDVLFSALRLPLSSFISQDPMIIPNFLTNTISLNKNFDDPETLKQSILSSYSFLTDVIPPLPDFLTQFTKLSPLSSESPISLELLNHLTSLRSLMNKPPFTCNSLLLDRLDHQLSSAEKQLAQMSYDAELRYNRKMTNEESSSSSRWNHTTFPMGSSKPNAFSTNHHFGGYYRSTVYHPRHAAFPRYPPDSYSFHHYSSPSSFVRNPSLWRPTSPSPRSFMNHLPNAFQDSFIQQHNKLGSPRYGGTRSFPDMSTFFPFVNDGVDFNNQQHYGRRFHWNSNQMMYPRYFPSSSPVTSAQAVMTTVATDDNTSNISNNQSTQDVSAATQTSDDLMRIQSFYERLHGELSDDSSILRENSQNSPSFTLTNIHSLRDENDNKSMESDQRTMQDEGFTPSKNESDNSNESGTTIPIAYDINADNLSSNHSSSKNNGNMDIHSPPDSSRSGNNSGVSSNSSDNNITHKVEHSSHIDKSEVADDTLPDLSSDESESSQHSITNHPAKCATFSPNKNRMDKGMSDDNNATINSLNNNTLNFDTIISTSSFRSFEISTASQQNHSRHSSIYTTSNDSNSIADEVNFTPSKQLNFPEASDNDTMITDNNDSMKNDTRHKFNNKDANVVIELNININKKGVVDNDIDHNNVIELNVTSSTSSSNTKHVVSCDDIAYHKNSGHRRNDNNVLMNDVHPVINNLMHPNVELKTTAITSVTGAINTESAPSSSSLQNLVNNHHSSSSSPQMKKTTLKVSMTSTSKKIIVANNNTNIASSSRRLEDNHEQGDNVGAVLSSNFHSIPSNGLNNMQYHYDPSNHILSQPQRRSHTQLLNPLLSTQFQLLRNRSIMNDNDDYYNNGNFHARDNAAKRETSLSSVKEKQQIAHGGSPNFNGTHAVASFATCSPAVTTTKSTTFSVSLPPTIRLPQTLGIRHTSRQHSRFGSSKKVVSPQI